MTEGNQEQTTEDSGAAEVNVEHAETVQTSGASEEQAADEGADAEPTFPPTGEPVTGQAQEPAAGEPAADSDTSEDE